MIAHLWWIALNTFGDWRFSRPREGLFLRVLVLVLGPLLVGSFAYAKRQNPQQVRSEYLRVATEAMREKKYDEADLLLRKALYLNADREDPGVQFWLANVSAQRHNIDQAKRIMYRIVNKPTTPPSIMLGAHLWLTEERISAEKLTPDEFAQVSNQILTMLNILKSRPKGNEELPSAVLAIALARETSDFISRMLPRIFTINLQAARMLAAIGQRNKAVEHAGVATEILRRLNKDQPKNAEIAVLLSQTLTFQDLYQEAEQVLVKCQQETKDDRLKGPLAELYLTSSQSLQTAGKASSSEIVQIVQRAYQMSPKDPRVLDRMLTFLGTGVGFEKKIVDELETYVDAILEKKPNSVDHRVAKATINVMRENIETATVEYGKAVDQRPSLRVVLARLYKKLDRPDDAKEQIGIGVSHYVASLEADPSRIADRIILADLYAERDDWDKAIETVKAGLAKDESTVLKNAMANLYLRWADQTEATNEKLAKYIRGLEHFPGNPGIQAKLFSLASDKTEVGEQTRKLLNERLLEGKDVPLVHLALGTAAADVQDYAKAKLHLEQALTRLPDNHVVLNNLAYVLLKGKPADPRRALTLIENAIKNAPSVIGLRETRGEILIALERWENAITDLETVLRAQPNQAKIHNLLSLAYKNLGNEDLALLHSEAAKEAEKK